MHERERVMVLRLHHEIPGMRIGVGEWIREVRKTADRGQSVEKQVASIAPGFVVSSTCPPLEGQTGNFGQAYSTGTKEGLIAFAMTLAREVARKDITVSRQRLLVLRIIDAFRKTMNAALGRAKDGEDRPSEVEPIFGDLINSLT
jgi:hypothetical protein